jgi:hypothetical protein
MAGTKRVLYVTVATGLVGRRPTSTRSMSAVKPRRARRRETLPA